MCTSEKKKDAMEALRDIYKFFSRTDKRLLVSFSFSLFLFPTYRTEMLNGFELSVGLGEKQVIFLHVRNRHDWKFEIDPGLTIYILIICLTDAYSVPDISPYPLNLISQRLLKRTLTLFS